MKTLAAAAAALVLAACATNDTTELRYAQERLAQHASADVFLDVDLAAPGVLTEEQRAPLVAAKRAQFEQCGAAFNRDFIAMVNAATDVERAASSADEMDAAFERCVATTGLVGHPELKVGDEYHRPADFVRSFHSAALRVGRLSSQYQAGPGLDGTAFALGMLAASRPAPGPAYQPVIAPRTTAVEVRCQSYRYGLYVNTTCR